MIKCNIEDKEALAVEIFEAMKTYFKDCLNEDNDTEGLKYTAHNYKLIEGNRIVLTNSISSIDTQPSYYGSIYSLDYIEDNDVDLVEFVSELLGDGPSYQDGTLEDINTWLDAQ